MTVISSLQESHAAKTITEIDCISEDPEYNQLTYTKQALGSTLHDGESLSFAL